MDTGSGAAKSSSTGKTSGGSSTVDAADDSESESESSSSSSGLEGSHRIRDPAEELESFRLQWKAELKKRVGDKTRVKGSKSNTITAEEPLKELEPSITDGAANDDALNTVEEQAKNWFLQGVGLERKGELYEAVRCYRRAVQLVPDIEYRVSTSTANAHNSSETSSSAGSPNDSENERDSDAEGDDDVDDGPLTVKFLKIIEANGWNFFQKIRDDNKSHLNDLPVEVLSYILRWVISNDLDVRSLDILSNTSRGFYCICRDEKLWEMACMKVWSDVNGTETDNDTIYPTFRDMFLKRPRVRFDGCYICKVTYIRPGEHSFQDQSYRPWHFVEYYRFIRFLPNGEILFLTSSDEPSVTVSGLRDDKYPRNPATLRGQYHLYGNNIVSAVVKKPTPAQTPVHRGRNGRAQLQDVTTFHLEFEICQVKSRYNWMLKWAHYAVYTSRYPISSGKNLNFNQINNANNNPTVSSTTFDLNPNKFPPLLFSRVKSYTKKSEGILTVD